VTVGGVHHVALLARDVGRLAAFYRDVLGLAELRRHHHEDGRLRSVWLQLGTGPAFLAVEPADEGAQGAAPQGPGWFLLALSIPAAGRSEARGWLQGRGVEVERESRWTLYVRDPEGNRVALSHHPEDPD
jgi:catechol 2,3-dioxygenase-like lactoylglutathione lyase family enzyme